MKTKLTIVTLLAALAASPVFAQAPRQAVIDAETSFAAQVAQNGMKTAFLASAASTALVAENGRLVDVENQWNSRQVKEGSRLTWYPLLADVAQSGDLGYTTGPWTMLQNERAHASGLYVRLWRKQPDGQWKYVVDMGIERIGVASAQSANVPGPRLGVAVGTPSMAPTSILLDLDKRFSEAELQKPGATYEQYLSSEVRLYRPGLSIMQGLGAIANMKNLRTGYTFTGTTGYLAAAGDLGYIVGTFRRAADAKHPEESGSYVRIWRREAEASWRIVLEMFNSPAPVAAPAVPAPVAAAPVSGAGTGTVVPSPDAAVPAADTAAHRAQ